ncbi:MAG: transcription antitermination factor NusB [Clostridia bacterium]|nr:transcription antitermination factor NusB [Clostridia bacterium]
MGRKKARENAFKCVFALGFENEYNLDNLLSSLSDGQDILEDEKEYIVNTFMGTYNNLKEIDEIILSNLKGWTIDRISKVDLAVLRLAIYEIKYDKNVPYKVSVNEAVEIAKAYGDDKSQSFVNGLLAKVEKNV